jgi:tight adherence protein C
MSDAINNIIAMARGDLGPLGPLIIAGVLGAFLIIVALPILLKKRADPLAKLKMQNATSSQGDNPQQALRNKDKSEKLKKYAEFLEPQDAKEFSAMKLKLVQAGYRSKGSVRTFHFFQFALGLGFLALGAAHAIFKSATADPSTQNLIMMTLIPGAVGYMAPKYWITRRIDTRKEEFEIVAHEMKAGKDKITVLKDMSERAGVSDVASFVTVLVQSASFGTSIADALRVFSAEMRDKRVMRAEEKANTLPTKMTLATMMLTVPPLLIILIGPSVHGVMNTLQASNF